MTKAEAAQVLGIGERMVTIHASNGRLGTVNYVKGKTRDVADFDPEAVERLKEELALANPKVNKGALVKRADGPLIKRASHFQTAKQEIPGSTFPGFSPELGALLVSGMKANVLQGLAAKPLLSASEINTLYGVPERETRAAMKEGALPSAKVGRSMKARRVDVDTWINKRFE